MNLYNVDVKEHPSPAGVAVQNVEGQRFMAKVSGSSMGVVVVVQRNGKNTCALETVESNVGGRKVGDMT